MAEECAGPSAKIGAAMNSPLIDTLAELVERTKRELRENDERIRAVKRAEVLAADAAREAAKARTAREAAAAREAELNQPPEVLARRAMYRRQYQDRKRRRAENLHHYRVKDAMRAANAFVKKLT